MSKATEKSRKIRFNVVDIIIIVAVMAIIASIIFVVLNRKSPDNSVSIRYTVRFEGVEDGALGYIVSGENMKNAAKASIGEVSAVRSERSKFYNKDALEKSENGYELTVSEYSDRHDVYVTVRGTAELDSHGIPVIEGEKILIGAYLGNVSISQFAGSGYVTAFEITEE